jgi:hypothetical protein
MVNQLLEANVDVNQNSNYHLAIAVSHDDNEMFNLLCDNGLNTNSFERYFNEELKNKILIAKQKYDNLPMCKPAR